MQKSQIPFSRFVNLSAILVCQFLTQHVMATGSGHIPVVLNWKPVQTMQVTEQEQVRFLVFEDAIHQDPYRTLPVFVTRIAFAGNQEVIRNVNISNEVYLPLTPEEVLAIGNPEVIPLRVFPETNYLTERKICYAELSVLPFRRNPDNGMIEKLLSFELSYRIETDQHTVPAISKTYVENSVLEQGNWYKLAVTSQGIYRITPDDFRTMGMQESSIDPRNIRIYGNGGGMLPEANSAPRIDDLREIAIQVVGEEDGRFDQGDYILFYGESQDQWSFNPENQLFHHTKNIYTDKTCYFLTVDLGPGKRILQEPGTQEPATHIISTFNDYTSYEKDDINLIKSGRSWYDAEYFDVTTSRSYSFVFPDLDYSTPVSVTTVVAARSTSGSTSFSVTANGNSLGNISIASVSDQYLALYARQKSGTGSFSSSSPVIEIQLQYTKPNPAAIGWLDYLEVNAVRNLVLSGSQMGFRSILSAGQGNISEFHLTTPGQPVLIWDVTDDGNVKSIQTSFSGGLCSFRLETDVLREFIAFDGATIYVPEYIGRVENQNLHGIEIPDYVILVHPSFAQEAEQLALFHREKNGYQVFITTQEQVFNEFSSGVPDLSAIRDFMKLLYDKSTPGNELNYLLLFGDASFDYKNRIPNNTNLILSYQSPESLDPVDSYVTDDFFALLDDTEGEEVRGKLDIGVGRFPVVTIAEAQSAVTKILHYCSNSDSVKNDWRNLLCFVADDEDGNIHMEQADSLTRMIDRQFPVYNINKIYLDAYQQLSTPGGKRAPEVNEAINQQVEKGALIINYTGHGGEVGWAHERILEVPDIKAWGNFNMMPVFVTATCEFSRFDDPERVSAGEWVFLNQKGGGIALFTTTRPTFANTNFSLSWNFYEVAFQKTNEQYNRMGDLILEAKNTTGYDANTRKFILLGDPALKMAYPNLNIVTSQVSADTLKALAEITISGEIQTDQGTLVSGFQGEVFPTVFDKYSEISTLSNDGNAVMNFYLLKNQIYKGKANVLDGQFSFSFIVPKDIAYKYGFGKISYYARSEETDANGYDNQVIVGGYNAAAKPDEEGPVITPYINDRTFISGGITSQNPVLLADVSDLSGINTVGNGIGHDITAVLDEDSQNPYILNDYYVADLNTFQSGIISYPFFNLSEGWHSLTLKVWDVYNNSSSANIEFRVVSSDDFVLERLYNYPNPFRDYTTFCFETNQTGINLEVEIQIFTIYGKLLRTIRKNLFVHGFRIEPVIWDGTSDNGWKVSSGIYVYRALVILPDGTSKSQTSKLVMIR